MTPNKQIQADISAIEVFEQLKNGNNRFVSNTQLTRNTQSQLSDTADGQFPLACVLTCIDSRTSPETIFDAGVGEMTAIRIAGNIINDDILGSMEFSCAALGTKVIVVLGHTSCGAVKAACDYAQPGGSITALVNKIAKSADAVSGFGADDRNSKNYDFVNCVTTENVHESVRNIISKSAILKNLVLEGKVIVVGGVYDIKTGLVDFYDKEIVNASNVSTIVSVSV